MASSKPSLNQVRITGDWESWLSFFLEGVRVTAEGAVDTSRRVLDLFATDRGAVLERGRRAGSGLRIHEALKERPILTIGAAAERTGLSFAGASSAMQLLVELDIAREVTGGRRNRLYVYDRYVSVLNEGTEVEPG